VPVGIALTESRFTPPDGIVSIDDTQRLVIGKYPLPPPPRDGRRMAYPPIFHPSTTNVVQASTIELVYGDDRTNVDLTLTPVSVARVSGVVHGPPEALQALTLRLLPVGLEQLGLGSEAATALVAADGAFTFTNVPAGAYLIDAPVSITELTGNSFDPRQPGRTRFPVPPPVRGSGMSSDDIDLVPGLSIATSTFRSGAAAYSGRTTVTVSGADVADVAVRLQPHAAMSGRVVVERDPAQPNVTPPGRFPIRLDPANGDASQGWPRTGVSDAPPDQFVMDNIAPGRYWLRVRGYPAWLVKSVTWNGRDYATRPFDFSSSASITDVIVTVTNAVPTLSGAVRASSPEVADAALVVIFPVDPAAWPDTGFWPAHLKAATVSSTRTFEIATLPAGDYLVAAISRSRAEDWRDPTFLQKLAPAASRVSLAWGERRSVDLTVVER
jgi:hypothetical protein